MYLIVIAWLYVTVMMAVAEASSPQGSILGAAITFTLYGLLPISILVYILGTPARKRKLQAQREAEQRAFDEGQAALHPQQAPSDLPDASSHAPRSTVADSVTPVREKP